MAQWLAAKEALLHKVAPLVAEAAILSGWQEHEILTDSGALACLLACLDPAALTSLDLNVHCPLPALVAQAAARLTSLRQLDLRLEPLDESAAGLLAATSGLQQLCMSAARLPDWVVRSSLLALQHLTCLELISVSEPLPPLQSLAALPRLQRFSALEQVSADGGMQLFRLADAPELTYINIAAPRIAVRGMAAAAAAEDQTSCAWLHACLPACLPSACSVKHHLIYMFTCLPPIPAGARRPAARQPAAARARAARHGQAPGTSGAQCR